MPRSLALLLTTLSLALVTSCGSERSSSAQDAGDAARGGDPSAEAPTPDLRALDGLRDPRDVAKAHPSFERYWYQGLAELSRYDLRQARYGELHKGEAVLIQVTEDFRADRQVKYEGGPRDNVVGVLKTNAYRRFYTGVYPYTLMTSSFTPVQAEQADPLKLTSTVQEWCGQAFMQVNRRPDKLEVQQFSYFQSEGDVRRELGLTMQEDGIFNRLRRAPQAMPTGELDVLPAMHHLRMRHEPLRALKAQASLSKVNASAYSKAPQYVYTVDYAGRARKVTYYVEQAFPHVIVAFTEEIGEPYPGAKPLKTEAVLSRRIMLDYWSRNGAADAIYREALGLTQ